MTEKASVPSVCRDDHLPLMTSQTKTLGMTGRSSHLFSFLTLFALLCLSLPGIACDRHRQGHQGTQSTSEQPSQSR